MAKLMNEHPSRDELRTWLRGEDLAAMDHVEDCDDCLGTLEDLSSLDPALMRTFLLITLPTPGFVDRVVAAVESRRQDGETWSVVSDLFSLGWHTIDTVWSDDG